MEGLLYSQNLVLSLKAWLWIQISINFDWYCDTKQWNKIMGLTGSSSSLGVKNQKSIQAQLTTVFL